MTKGPHKRGKTLVCKSCHTEFTVSRAQAQAGMRCPECGVAVPAPVSLGKKSIKIID